MFALNRRILRILAARERIYSCTPDGFDLFSSPAH